MLPFVNNLKYNNIALTFLLFFMVFCGLSQEIKKDTVTLVKQFQKESLAALVERDYQLALKNLVSADKLIAPTKNNKLKAALKISSANVNYIIKNFPKAESEAAQAITLLGDLNEKSLLAQSHSLYGLILTRLNYFRDAEESIQKANNIYVSLGDESEQA